MMSNYSCAYLLSIHLFGKMLFICFAYDLAELFFTAEFWEIFVFLIY